MINNPVNLENSNRFFIRTIFKLFLKRIIAYKR